MKIKLTENAFHSVDSYSMAALVLILEQEMNEKYKSLFDFDRKLLATRVSFLGEFRIAP